MLFRLLGAHVSEDSTAGTTGAVSVKVALCVPPFSDAVMVAVSFTDTPATVAPNCALLCPADTVTDAGTVTFALPSDTVTSVLAATADTNVTVHVALPAALKLFGAQLSPDSPAGATRLTCVVRATPFKFAVTVAV